MGLIEDFRTSRIKVVKTAIICFAYVTLGFNIAVIGPTMIDLGYLVSKPVSAMNYLLVSRAIGTLLSCLLTDFHKKYLSFEKLLAISQLFMGITLFIMPFFDLIGMNIVIFIYGYAAGCFQVFGDLMTMKIWNKKRAAIYIQYVYFFFSLGAFIAPVLSAPFLAPTVENKLPDEFKKSNQTNSNSTDITDQDLALKHTLQDLKVMYPYMISGVYGILVAVIFYLVDATSNKKEEYTEIENEDNEKKSNQKQEIEKPRCSNYKETRFENSAEIIKSKEESNERSALLNKKDYNGSGSLINSSEFSAVSTNSPNLTLIKVLSVLFVNLFIGFDVSFGTYLSVYVFVNEAINLSTVQGAYLTAAFWASYTFAFRIPGYYIIQHWGPNVLMNIEMVITFLSTILLSFLLVSNSLTLLWSSVILEGLGMSIVYSTYLAFLKTKFEPDHRLCSWFVIAFNVGSFVYPYICGMYIETYPMIFIYLSIFLCLGTTFIYVYVRYLFRKWK